MDLCAGQSGAAWFGRESGRLAVLSGFHQRTLWQGKLSASPTENGTTDDRVGRALQRIFGLETEYGITVSDAERVDGVAESIQLLRDYTEHGALMRCDYELEDPHLDGRGFNTR